MTPSCYDSDFAVANVMILRCDFSCLFHGLCIIIERSPCGFLVQGCVMDSGSFYDELFLSPINRCPCVLAWYGVEVDLHLMPSELNSCSN
jgi:hypothetical protein